MLTLVDEDQTTARWQTSLISVNYLSNLWWYICQSTFCSMTLKTITNHSWFEWRLQCRTQLVELVTMSTGMITITLVFAMQLFSTYDESSYTFVHTVSDIIQNAAALYFTAPHRAARFTLLSLTLSHTLFAACHLSICPSSFTYHNSWIPHRATVIPLVHFIVTSHHTPSFLDLS